MSEIGTMNHYYQDGQRMIYVCLTRGDRFMKVEGPDTPEIWNILKKKAQH